MSAEPVTVGAFRFYDQESMQHSLEEYSTWLDGIKTTRYGDASDGGDGVDPDAQIERSRCRSELDRCMEDLQAVYPLYHRLLDVFYRGGCSTHPRGWTVVAGMVKLRAHRCPLGVRCPLPGLGTEGEDHRHDLKTCRDQHENLCTWDREVFYAEVEQAVGRLYVLHQRRHQRPTGKRGT